MPNARTIDIYISSVNALQTKLENPPTDKYNFIKDSTNVIKYVNETIPNINTRRGKFNALIYFSNIFNYDPAPYQAQVLQLNQQAQDEQTNVKTDKQEANWVDVGEIDSKINKLKKELPKTFTTYDDYRMLTKYLIVLFHNELPVRNDLADAKVVFGKEKTDDDINYIQITNKKGAGNLIMKKYKTQHKYGLKTIPIPKKIVLEVVKYEKVMKQFSPAGWFVASREENDKPITRNNYTKIFQSIFAADGKKVGSTQFRRTAVSKVHKPSADEIQKKKELANIMMHSVVTAAAVYAKAD